MRGLLLQTMKAGKVREYGITNQKRSSPAGSSSYVQDSTTFSTVPLDLSRNIFPPAERLQDESLAAHCFFAGCRPSCTYPSWDNSHQLQSSGFARFRGVYSL